MVRKLYDPANSLANKYAGPYRIDEVIGKGRYRVRDLENRLIYNEIDVSNLRPYKTLTDEEDLTPDEYVIEELIDRRVVKGKRSYLAKYLGFPRNQAEWTSRTELARRCEDLMDEYDALHPISKKGKRAALRETIDSATESEDSTPMPKPGPSRGSTIHTGKAPQVPTDDTESHLPKGSQICGRQVVLRPTNTFAPNQRDETRMEERRALYPRGARFRRVPTDEKNRGTVLREIRRLRGDRCVRRRQPERLTPPQKIQSRHP